MKELMHQLTRRLYPYGAIRMVLLGPLRGMKFEVRPGMGATFALGVDAFHWSKIAPQIKPGMQVWDVGANCGQMALFFSRLVGSEGRVHSFEPAAANVEVLRHNVELNDLQNITVHGLALASTSGEAEFVFDEFNHQMGGLLGSSVKLPGRKGTLKVKCATVDELVNSGLQPPELMKIDVEGGGAEVIAGAARTLTKFHPRILFELHADNTDGPELLAVQRLKKEWGYKIEVLSGNLNEVPDHLWGATVLCS